MFKLEPTFIFLIIQWLTHKQIGIKTQLSKEIMKTWDIALGNCTFWDLVFLGQSDRSAAGRPNTPLGHASPLRFIGLFRLLFTKLMMGHLRGQKPCGGKTNSFNSLPSCGLTPINQHLCQKKKMWQFWWQEHTNLKFCKLSNTDKQMYLSYVK